MKKIEVEARSFIGDDEYDAIKRMLDAECKFAGRLDETTIYFSGAKDLRMRMNETEASIILKEGNIHDASRQESEIRIKREDFADMIQIFESLGYEIEIEWFRIRLAYESDGMAILLDNTKGYGKILEIEKLAEEGGEQEVHDAILSKLHSLGVDEVTPRKEFDERFEYYKRNWKTLTR